MTKSPFTFLGVRVHAMTKHDLVSVAAEAVREGTKCVVANHNLHSLYLWRHEPNMRAFYSVADYIHIDGMSIVLLGRLLGLPLTAEHRTQYVDLLPLLADQAAKHQWRVFYLGSKPGVAEKAARILRTQYPELQIVTRDGYFDVHRSADQNRAVVAEIKDYAPHILMVGMGMPRQEIWLAENLNDLRANTIYCCGALMDFIAGEIPTPPRWLGPLGLEWLYRLLSEPARLWRRYLIEPWSILIGVLGRYFRYGQISIGVETSKHE